MGRLKISSLPLAALAAAVALGAAAPASASPGVVVAIDHATRLKLARPAGSVIVGNPNVADVTVVDANTVFVTGRGYGVSEVVVLDPLGRTVWVGDVVVTSPNQGEVSIYRGGKVTEMACASTCATTARSAKAGGGAGGGGGGNSVTTMPSTQIGAPQPSPNLP